MSPSVRDRGGAHLRWVLVRHVLALTGVALLVLGLVLWQGERTAERQARQATELNVRTLAYAFAAPLHSADLSQEPGAWSETVDAAVDGAEGGPQVREVKVWRPIGDGRAEVLYSTRSSEIGTRSVAGSADEVLAPNEDAIREVDAQRSAALDSGVDLYEAYVGFTDANERPFVLEVYKPVRDRGQYRAALLRSWLPISLGGVGLLGVATLPLSLRLSRRVSETERELGSVARHALDAVSEEKRRIGAELHEHVVPDLSGARLLLGSLRGDGYGAKGAVLDRLDDILAGDLDVLRGMLDGVHTVEWSGLPFPAAVTAWCREIGLDPERVTCEVQEGVVLEQAPTRTAFRIIKEALRNVHKHAGEASVVVRASATGPIGEPGAELLVSVDDDGCGFAPSAGVTDREHAGTRIMTYTAEAVGGSLDVVSEPGEGVSVRVRLPYSSRTSAPRVERNRLNSEPVDQSRRSSREP